MHFLCSSPEAGNPGVASIDVLVLTHTAAGMLAFLKGAVQPMTVSRARSLLQKRDSSIYSKPAKNKIGPGVSETITES